MLERVDLPALDLLEGLVGLQAQTPQSPYVSVWSRIDAFDPEELSGLIRDRKAVRVALMRSTIHLVSARDCLRLRPLVQPSIDRTFAGSSHSKLAAGADADEVAAAARAILREEPVTFTDLGRRLAERFDGDAGALAQVARTHVTLVQIPLRGLWRQAGAPRIAAAEDWLGKPLARRPSLPALVRRYLGAFGPASVRDLQAWSGLTRLGEVVDRLRPELDVLHDERGKELFDVRGAPRPHGETPAPVRFLPDYDNILLGHADRSRMISDDDRRALPIGKPTVLVDGFVRATWRFDRARGKLAVEPLGRLTRPERSDLAAESERLVGFLTGRPA